MVNLCYPASESCMTLKYYYECLQLFIFNEALGIYTNDKSHNLFCFLIIILVQSIINETMATQTSTALESLENGYHILLDEAILTRHSTRLFLPKPVPQEVIQNALQLAMHSPSNSNTQVWRLYVVTGPALERLKSNLVEAASTAPPHHSTPLPDEFRPFRSELGKSIYGEGWGIPRGDDEARKEAVLKNYEFFGAPVGIIVCMSKKLSSVAAFSVGMYLQTLLLALTEAGVGSCVQVSIAGYRDVVRQTVGLADDVDVLCGVAVGYEDEAANVNKVRIGRSAVDETTTFVDA